MKRLDLIRALEGFGCVLIRHGGKHDWYRNPATGVSQPVPRHRDLFAEVIEDVSLVNAIREGEKTKQVNRERVMKTLRDAR